MLTDFMSLIFYHGSRAERELDLRLRKWLQLIYNEYCLIMEKQLQFKFTMQSTVIFALLSLILFIDLSVAEDIHLVSRLCNKATENKSSKIAVGNRYCKGGCTMDSKNRTILILNDCVPKDDNDWQPYYSGIFSNCVPICWLGSHLNRITDHFCRDIDKCTIFGQAVEKVKAAFTSFFCEDTGFVSSGMILAVIANHICWTE